MITLKDPVGLYVHSIDDAGWRLGNGTTVQGGFRLLRGWQGLALRAEYRLPDDLAAQGFTVSDVQIAGVDIEFGGQIAEKISMRIVSTACGFGSVTNGLVPCGALPVGLVSAAAGQEEPSCPCGLVETTCEHPRSKVRNRTESAEQ